MDFVHLLNNIKMQMVIKYSPVWIISHNIFMAHQKLNFLKILLLHLIVPSQHPYLEYIIFLTGKMVFQVYFLHIFPNFDDQRHIFIHLKVFYLNKIHLLVVKFKSFIPELKRNSA